MTQKEAKTMLQACRTGGEDESDSFFAEALEDARRDQKLGQWYHEQQVFDSSMRDALSSVKPPADLKAAILSAHCGNPPKVSARFRFSKLWAIAAAAALLLGVAFFIKSTQRGLPAMSVASFTREALSIKEQNRIVLGTKNADPEELRAWLAERGVPHDFEIPPGLKGLPSLGCQSYLVHGTKVALICFDLGNNQIAHLFVVEKSDLADAVSDTKPQLQIDHGLAFAMWTAGDKSFVLTGDNLTEETLRRLI